MKKVDSDGSGSIDYCEFVAATVDHRTYMQRDVCWAAFRVFDLDGDGKITREELHKVLSGTEMKKLNSDLVASMIKDVDKDGDGCIDFEEFCAMMSAPST